MKFYLQDYKDHKAEFEIEPTDRDLNYHYIYVVLSGDELIIGCKKENGYWAVTYDSCDEERVSSYFDDLTYIGTFDDLKNFLQKEGRLLD